MTDRELLELAAKAAGLDSIVDSYGWDDIGGGCFLDGNEPPTVWNPLKDDGDALRLFVRMPFSELYVSEIGVTVFLPRKPVGEGLNLKCDEYAEEHGGDIAAATRRAITRAAAEIQRQREASK